MELQITETKFKDGAINAINARDLHTELKVKKDFSDWIKQQLMIGRKNTVYIEGIDYLKNHLKGVRQIEYILTIETAKKLSMLSKTKKGNEVRKYFLEAEKQALTPQLPKSVMKDIRLALTGLVEVDERLDTHNDRIKDVEQYIIEDMKNRPIDHTQQTALLNARHRKVLELLEHYDEDKSDKELKRKTYAKVGSLFKKKFNLPRYDALPNVKFDDGISFLQNIKLKDI